VLDKLILFEPKPVCSDSIAYVPCDLIACCRKVAGCLAHVDISIEQRPSKLEGAIAQILNFVISAAELGLTNICLPLADDPTVGTAGPIPRHLRSGWTSEKNENSDDAN
jgi:hypothetical protein